jgi:hypothetical protein
MSPGGLQRRSVFRPRCYSPALEAGASESVAAGGADLHRSLKCSASLVTGRSPAYSSTALYSRRTTSSSSLSRAGLVIASSRVQSPSYGRRSSRQAPDRSGPGPVAVNRDRVQRHKVPDVPGSHLRTVGVHREQRRSWSGSASARPSSRASASSSSPQIVPSHVANQRTFANFFGPEGLLTPRFRLSP